MALFVPQVLGVGYSYVGDALQYQLANPLEFCVYAVLGVAGGLVSVVFTKLLLKTREWFLSLPQWKNGS
jgi:CIC family chloride channel protein